MAKAKNTVDAAIGQRLKVMRLERNLSQASLAGILKLDELQYHKIEIGRERLSARGLAAVSELFDEPVSAFFEGLQACDMRATNFTVAPVSELADLLCAFSRVQDPEKRREILEIVQNAANG